MKKLLSIMLLLSVSVCSACSNTHTNSKEERYVPEGADYYTAKNLVLADEYKTNPQYAFTNIKQDYFGHDMIAVSIMTEQDDRTQNIIELYDYEGTRLGSITAGDSIQFIECIDGDNNGLKALVEDYNNQVSIHTLNTQSVSLDRFCDVQFAKSLNSFEANRLFVLDTGFIISYNYQKGSVYQAAFARIDPDGNLEWTVDVGNGGDDSTFTSQRCDDKVFYSVEDGFYSISVEDGIVSKISMPDETKEKFNAGGKIGEDGGVYVLDGTTIRRYDLNTCQETDYLDINYCDCNLFRLTDGNISYISNDKMVFSDLSSTRNEPYGRCKLTVINKASTNPYVGRKIIDVATIWGITNLIGQSRLEFNHNETEYFAELSMRYDSDYIDIPDYLKDSITLMERTTYSIDKLSQDIISGNGPDVIVGLGDVTQLNSTAYLRDLNSLIDGDEGLRRDEFFDVAFSAYSNDNGLFQIPLTIYVYGYMTNKENFTGDREGFTFEEYREYIEEACKGIDPISIGNTREDYFRFLFSSMHDYFIPNDSSINVDNPEFRKLVDYMCNNVSESGSPSKTISAFSQWTVLANMYDDLLTGACVNPDWDIYGGPSFDGRGPMFSNFNTVAIPINGSNPDACWRLVKTMLSEPIQSAYTGIETPINLNAYDAYAKMVVADINTELMDQGKNYELGESDILRYKQMLQKAKVSAVVDSQLYQIILEELRPVFAGEKSIEDAIPVITNRCNTLIKERLV